MAISHRHKVSNLFKFFKNTWTIRVGRSEKVKTRLTFKCFCFLPTLWRWGAWARSGPAVCRNLQTLLSKHACYSAECIHLHISYWLMLCMVGQTGFPSPRTRHRTQQAFSKMCCFFVFFSCHEHNVSQMGSLLWSLMEKKLQWSIFVFFLFVYFFRGIKQAVLCGVPLRFSIHHRCIYNYV